MFYLISMFLYLILRVFFKAVLSLFYYILIVFIYLHVLPFAVMIVMIALFEALWFLIIVITSIIMSRSAMGRLKRDRGDWRRG